MKIEKITRSQRNNDLFYLSFEDGTSLKANVALIADYSLYTGRALTDDEYEALCNAAEATGSRARALRMLGSRAMSRREITDRLVSKGEAGDVAEDTADWLERIGAVNDEEYAGMIVRHYTARGYGPARVRDELYRRGIARELWEDALSEMPGSDDKLAAFLESRLRGEKPDRAELKRVISALQRRGFSWDEIKSATDRYINDIEEQEL